MPASRIHAITSALASFCCGDRKTRVRPPSISDNRASASQWSHTRRASRAARIAFAVVMIAGGFEDRR